MIVIPEADGTVDAGGVGLALEEGSPGYTALGGALLADGADVVPCAQSFGSATGPDGAAGGGAVLGAASLGYGAPGVFIPRLPRLLRGVLDAHALLFSVFGWGLDASNYPGFGQRISSTATGAIDWGVASLYPGHEAHGCKV